MGNLKPNTTYIYERVDGIVYAREAGADPSSRFEIGSDYDPEKQVPSTFELIKEDKLWGDIRRAAKTNSALQAELERVKMLYFLLKEEKYQPPYHPV